MKHFTYLIAVLISLVSTMFIGTACSDDDDHDTQKIHVQVAVRVDNHVPPTVTVFDTKIPLTNDNWIITQEAYRLYESDVRVNKSTIKYVPTGPFSSLSQTAQGIIEVNSVQGKRDFTVITETHGNRYLFILK